MPLWRHLDDSAAVAGRLWDEWLPGSVRRAVGAVLPGGVADGRRLVEWLAGVHDIGKATPAFAVQMPGLAGRMRQHGLAMPSVIPYADRKLVPHALAGQILVEDWLCGVHGWTSERAQPFAVVLGGHHGVPPTYDQLVVARDHPSLLGLGAGQAVWRTVQRDLLDRAAARLDVAGRLKDWQSVELPQAVQVLLTAVVIVADWIASNDELFPYDVSVVNAPSRFDDAWCLLDLPRPWQAVPSAALVASTGADLFRERFDLPNGNRPRPVQVRAVELARAMPNPGLLIVEAPMGEGKTEAALACAEVLAARSGAGGCFVALPTRATSDAMFQRVLAWLRKVPDVQVDRGAVAVTLAHGKARLNEDFQSLVRRGWSSAIAADAGLDAGRLDLAAHQWLSGRKKSLLSSFAVGTIDQLLFGALKSRHLALRHLGLAGKVVIIDEAHAYDVYMSQYLDRALEWLGAYEVPTIVLSATLPAMRRRDMVVAYDRGHSGQVLGEVGHPGEVGAGPRVVTGEVDRHLHEVPGGDLQRSLLVPAHDKQTFSRADQDLGFRHRDLPFARNLCRPSTPAGPPLSFDIPADIERGQSPIPLDARPISGENRGDMSPNTLAIEASGLVKAFGETKAVNGVDLSVRRGSVYGVLGPNGAGKTTIIRMLATLLRPDAGEARVLGHDLLTDPDAVRAGISLTGQFASVDEDLTGRENLILIGRLLGLKRAAVRDRANELLEAFGLSEAGNRLVKTYSGGMRRRLDIAASVVVTPELMFLDEPTTGLDPRSRNQVWEIIRALVTGGATILLCTQYLEEADQLADGIAVVDHGRVIAEGTPAQLKSSVGAGTLEVRLFKPEQRDEAAALLERLLGPVTFQADPASLSVTCSDAHRAAATIAGMSRSGIEIADFSLGQPSLDEVFLALTGHPAEETPEEEPAGKKASR